MLAPSHKELLINDVTFGLPLLPKVTKHKGLLEEVFDSMSQRTPLLHMILAVHLCVPMHTYPSLELYFVFHIYLLNQLICKD